MLKLHSKQHIKFATIDRGNAWVVVAILLETRGNETFAISEPKIVKIIAKSAQLALSGSVKSTYFLPEYKAQTILKKHAVVSPYINHFGHSSSNIIPLLSAQPPTI